MIRLLIAGAALLTAAATLGMALAWWAATARIEAAFR
jgi:hypothetical protein